MRLTGIIMKFKSAVIEYLDDMSAVEKNTETLDG